MAWTLNIRNTVMIKCGGCIYSENVIITAAHCCAGRKITNEKDEIIAGELYLQKVSDDFQNSKIKEFVIHPDYNEISLENDICLLYLENPLILSANTSVDSIDLADEDNTLPTECTISGWGTERVFIYYLRKSVNSVLKCTECGRLTWNLK